jgi:two-component system, sensor histidine kinase
VKASPGPSHLPDSAARSAAPAHVLIVEDDEGARAALRMLLELLGYAVAEAADGDGAVAHALAHRPRVAVVDIGLPGLDGYGVARRIREGLGGAPMLLIALTGYPDIEDRARADTGFDAHLIKPLKFERLFQLLEQVAPSPARPA